MSAVRPRVALVSDCVFPYHRGGKEMRYRALAERLAGHVDLDVYTMNWWDGATERRVDGVAYRALCARRPLYVDGRRSIRQALVFGASCLRLLRRRFDVIEADQIPFAQIFVLRLVASLRRRRLVVTWHEVWDLAYWRSYLGPVPGVAAALLGRVAMLLPDEIIAASPQSAARLRPRVRSGTAITVAPNGIDLAAVARARPAAEASDLIFVGRLIEHKGVDLLLEAVAAQRAKGRPLKTIVIGSGPHLPHLRRRAVDLRVDDLVDFRDDVEEAEGVYGLLKASRAFVFPSMREGFGIVILEALACGLPVVTTSHPDNLSQHLAAASGRGHVCPPTTAGVEAAIEAALADERDDERAQALLRAHSWDAVADAVLHAYTR
jgi:glycosyltransferase involved in cell wall biosynthesis